MMFIITILEVMHVFSFHLKVNSVFIVEVFYQRLVSSCACSLLMLLVEYQSSSDYLREQPVSHSIFWEIVVKWLFLQLCTFTCFLQYCIMF